MTISVNSAAGAKGNEVNFLTDANGNVTGLEAPLGKVKLFDSRKAPPSTYMPAFQSGGAGASISTLTIPNPYEGSQANAPVHPAVLFFENGWNRYRYWMAFTPYPNYDSTYENPSVIASNDFETWVAPATNPLVSKPTGGYNADTHLFMSEDGETMYLAFRERGVSSKNNLKVMHTTDGVTWSTPVTIMTGTQGSQDFACPSIWWNGTAWTCLAHNLDATAPWPIQRYVSSTADVYGAWGSASTVTMAPASGRAWWHTHFQRVPSGQIIGIAQDNNQSAGGSGNLYIVESGDDGATFGAIRQIVQVGAGIYRSCACVEVVNDVPQLRLVVGDFAGLTLKTVVLPTSAAKSPRALLDQAWGAIGVAARGFASLKWADTFVRADSASAIGTADSGGSYTVSSGTWGISSNSAYVVSSGKVLAAIGTDCYRAGVQFTDITNAIQQWFMFRVQDASNYWRVGVSAPTASGAQTLAIQSVVSGSVVVNTAIGYISRGDYLHVESTPGGFRIYVNGVLQTEYINSLYGTATSVGLQGNAGASTKYRHLAAIAL